MKEKKSKSTNKTEKVVTNYFKLIHDLRKGDEKSIPKLMALWDQDGVFEFAGASPVVGTFKGAMAINTLYKNRLNSCKMGLAIETKAGKRQEVTLGTVDTEVSHLRTNGNRAVAGWRTTIGTQEGHGFDVAGSHLFVIDGDKIKSVRVTVSPGPTKSHLEALNLANLSVNDVGRLSLAAWPVV